VKLHIVNEYDPLEAVLVHRPGAEIDRLRHDNMREFLFEDLPYMRRMQDEHDAFTETMRQRGIEVFELADLVRDVLAPASPSRREVIQEVCARAQVPTLAADLLDERLFPVDDLVRVLFTGITRAEYRDLTGRDFAGSTPAEEFVLPPIPNAYFTRDPAVVVRNCAISCKMHFVARSRESLLVRAVLEHHPRFVGAPVAYGGSRFPTEDRPFTIEGGDVIVLNEEAVLVGASERTRSATIEVLAMKALDAAACRRVYEIPIPTERLFMHLDTVFTIVDRGVVVWFPGVMEHVREIQHYEAGPAGGLVRKPESRDLRTLLADEFGGPLTVIETAGGDKHYASREQRTDGTNVFAVAPRTAISYNRNERTIAALEKAGVECLRIEGSELVRGLGGPRCMTMPLRRRAAGGN
jgi:arginine deiminase